jgi:C4-dicarboxylate-specific signal transduction histidine kinase
MNLVLLAYGALLAFALGAIFYWRVFPDCYREDVGLTPFESIGLVTSCSAYLVALVLLFRTREDFGREVFPLLAATLIAFFVEDAASALATELNGFARTIAHLCQVVALYCVYKAFVEIGLRKPYDLLFRRQQQSAEEQLQRHRTELAHVARLSMMGEMAASLAHELNQPLHAVNNYARGSIRRLQKAPQKDGEIFAALEQISAEANRAAEIVRRVRRFVQKGEPQFSEVRVNRLVEEVVLLAKTELEQRHVRVDLALTDDLPMALGDPIQIEQVLMNLLRNGLEAMEETPQEDRIVCIRSMQYNDDRIQVDVCDAGSGIAGEDLEKLFEPFFTTKPQGMGMGLAISRSIIQAHGGQLWASANHDRGSTFHFTLPVGGRR